MIKVLPRVTWFLVIAVGSWMCGDCLGVEPPVTYVNEDQSGTLTVSIDGKEAFVYADYVKTTLP